MTARLASLLTTALVLVPSAALAIGHAATPITPETKDSLIVTGTLMRIKLVQTVSSSSSHKGDIFDFVIVDDVKAGSRVAIPAGSRGMGRVVAVSPAHGGRVDGHLRVQFSPIMMSDGTEVKIAITQESLNEDANERNSMAGDVMQIADMTIPGLFLIDWLRKGDDVTIGAGKPFHIGVTQDAFLTSGTVTVLPPVAPTPEPTPVPTATPTPKTSPAATAAPAATSAPVATTAPAPSASPAASASP
jgi:hypothetical protein